MQELCVQPGDLIICTDGPTGAISWIGLRSNINGNSEPIFLQEIGEPLLVIFAMKQKRYENYVDVTLIKDNKLCTMSIKHSELLSCYNVIRKNRV